MSPQQEQRIAEALRHVEMGFAVMSVWSTTPDGTCKCGKQHADGRSIGKHPIPPDGFKAASTDPGAVRTMLSAGSEPNYGIVWPENSPKGVVLEWDVDGSEWKAKIEALKATFGPLPPTKTTRSPSGGLHVFYFWPEGLPVPDGNTFHGFVVRWPWKGYVVGPGSRINGTTYKEVGAAEIAMLPLSWAVTEPVRGSAEPLITVAGAESAYELPERVETGHRHDEIARFVASRWNKRVTKEEIVASARGVLAKRFAEPMDDARLVEEVDHAFETARKRWIEPGPGTAPVSGEIVIDPLAIESRIERPETMDPHTMPLPTGLALLLQHYEPITDVKYSSLLLASSVTMSALVGPAPTLRWRGMNRASLFGVLVGHTNWGRKGQTMRVVERAFQQVDPMIDEITKSGVASGEALVDVLKDAKSNSLNTVLIREHEITNLMAQAARDGSILSGMLRMLWDGDRIETRSRTKGTQTASGYGASFLAGVTPASLERYLDADEVSNGWANRFLWFHSEPRGNTFDSTLDDSLDPTTLTYLRDCISFARGLGGGSALIRLPHTMFFAPEALIRMNAVWTALDTIPFGAIGALRQRMPGHIVRLAMVAAVFDQTNEVGLDHVTFGERMAAYAVDSMRSVFGFRLDDPVAMLILSVLGQTPDGWLNTTTLKAVTGKEYSRVQTALRLLLAEGWITREDRASGGRPSVGYRLRKASGSL